MNTSRDRWVVGMVAISLLISPGMIFADGKEKSKGKVVAEGDVAKRVSHLKEKLTLTDDQTQKVQTILEASQKTLQADREAMEQHKEQTTQQILAILNDKQKAQYVQMKEDRKSKWHQHHHDEDHKPHHTSSPTKAS